MAEKGVYSSYAHVIINTIWLDDFWNATNANVPEDALITFNGSSAVTVTASKPFNPAPDPTSFAGLYGGLVSSILFQAIDPGAVSGDGDDFALARIDYSPAPVPVPPAFWLLGSGLVFLFRKRQTG